MTKTCLLLKLCYASDPERADNANLLITVPAAVSSLTLITRR